MNLFSEKKEEIKNYKAPQNAFLPKTVCIPLCAEFNKECQEQVKIGDKVREGQIIAVAKDNNNTLIHASIPGTVTDILSIQCPNGKTERAVKIALSGNFDYLGKVSKRKNLNSLSPEQLENLINPSGIINTFDTRKPLNIATQIQNFSGSNLVIRLFDEDPSCITDRLVARFFLDEIMEGAVLLLRVLNAQNIIFLYNSKLIPQNLFDAKKTDQMYFYDMNDLDYPAGLKSKVISSFNKNPKFKTTGIKLSKQDLFCDSQTVYEVYKTSAYSVPSITHFIHISGNCLKASCILNVRIGSTIKEIINQIGGLSRQPKQIIINGKIRGYTVGSLDTPITRYVKSISVITESNPFDSKIYDCINCGNCRSVCKSKILPDFVYSQAVNFNLLDTPGDEEDFETTFFIKQMIGLCTNCFECNMVCPARLPISQLIKTLKDDFNV